MTSDCGTCNALSLHAFLEGLASLSFSDFSLASLAFLASSRAFERTSLILDYGVRGFFTVVSDEIGCHAGQRTDDAQSRLTNGTT